ncbi:LIC11966 family surface protein [Croceimicrobium hydrocarbonivorans]|uniref:Uncharacterized protein n=1 Tax=Croceimicrobium hydrocarbonivorans TaxID=2761580 RepID=A0A7H0VCK7_9FLAO|nr:hypothetical protein [Croceimicrobium hydrocarbonivorans]QNR23455.1 hypothetical protein H4K34_13860 [Croceimicrobium hydrocarbonivorans]
MKQTLAICLLLLGAFSMQAQSAGEAAAYMGQIGESIEEMKGETWSYLKAATRGRSARTLERKRQSIIEELKNVKSEIRKIGAFKGDRSYQQEVINYLDMTDIVLREDYAKIMDMEDIAERSYDGMEAYLLAKDIAGEKMDSAFSIYKNAEEAFANKYGVNLIEGEKTKKDEKIAKANKALKYYNRIFLEVFRAQVQEAYVVEALNNADLVSLEQNLNALKTAVAKAQANLDTFSTFGGDKKLLYSAQRLLKYYENSCANNLPKLVDFYVKKDNFDRLQKKMEATKKRDLTQEDVDAFNAAVEDYNKMVPEFNNVNERNNEAREQAIKSWEDGVEDFFDQHA